MKIFSYRHYTIGVLWWLALFLLCNSSAFVSSFVAVCHSKYYCTLEKCMPIASVGMGIGLYSGRKLLCKIDDHRDSAEASDLLDLLMPSKKCDVSQLSPTSLAYIGDAVYELFVRSRYAWPSRRTTAYREMVVGAVRAEAQAKLLADLMKIDTPLEFNSILIDPLSADELNVCRRGRNVGKNNNRTPKRLGGEAGNQNVYQDSTALEALLGYLYIEHPQRCNHILSWVETQLEPPS